MSSFSEKDHNKSPREKLKNFFKEWATNLLLIALAFYLLIQKGPGIVERYKIENQFLQSTLIEKISGEKIAFPVVGTKTLAIFWMIHCGPCKVELSRINKLVANKVLAADQVLAVNLVDVKTEVQKFSAEQGYEFTLALDSDGAAAQKFNVESTPTIFLLDEAGKIHWATSGISPFLEIRIKQFFKK